MLLVHLSNIVYNQFIENSTVCFLFWFFFFFFKVFFQHSGGGNNRHSDKNDFGVDFDSQNFDLRRIFRNLGVNSPYGWSKFVPGRFNSINKAFLIFKIIKGVLSPNTLTDTGEDSKLLHRRKRPKVDTLFCSFFCDASERRVWLSAESKILASTFGRFRLYRLSDWL